MAFKAASLRGATVRTLALLGLGGASLQVCAVLLAVLALRTMDLSQLVSFAAIAYVLVPLGGHFVFGERLLPHFWLGSFLIVAGILCANV